MNRALERQLASAARRRAKAQEEYESATRALHALIGVAGTDGVPKTHIAEAVGMSRQTVHAILREVKS